MAVEKLSKGVYLTHFIVYLTSIFTVSVAMVLLWQYLGPSSLAGLAVLMLLVFSNLFFARIVKRFQVSNENQISTYMIYPM